MGEEKQRLAKFSLVTDRESVFSMRAIDKYLSKSLSLKDFERNLAFRITLSIIANCIVRPITIFRLCEL